MCSLEEKAEDTKREIRSRISKDRQYNGQKKKYNNHLQSTTHKTEEQATRTPLIGGCELMCSGRVSSSSSSSDHHHVSLGDKSYMKKGSDCDYDKQNISVVIYGTDIL